MKMNKGEKGGCDFISGPDTPLNGGGAPTRHLRFAQMIPLGFFTVERPKK